VDQGQKDLGQPVDDDHRAHHGADDAPSHMFTLPGRPHRHRFQVVPEEAADPERTERR
jgi:hypothetical protein